MWQRRAGTAAPGHQLLADPVATFLVALIGVWAEVAAVRGPLRRPCRVADGVCMACPLRDLLASGRVWRRRRPQALLPLPLGPSMVSEGS